MASQSSAVLSPFSLSTDQAGAFRYVARQPILDLRGRVHGYELLFRDGPHQPKFSADGELATRTILDNTIIFGLQKLTGGLPAFVNCTRESLTDKLVDVLSPSMFVLEILEDIEPTPEVIHACRRLKTAGFRLALDDFRWQPGCEPLVELADYIKVDFTLSGIEERREIHERIRGRAVALVAEKIETLEQFREARNEGFTLIQGYYFCRPELIENRKIPPNKLTQIEILRLLHEDNLNFDRLCHLVKRDASLTYRLLRLLNSPACAVRQEVRSVKSALIAVGEEGFRRIAVLAIASEMSAGQPGELLRLAFVRGRFCELAAEDCGLDSMEQYLLGLLSLLPAMLRVPMPQLVPALPLREEICVALMGAAVQERMLLEWLICHEHGQWDDCDRIADEQGLNQVKLLNRYAESLVWAEAALNAG
ncbi:MAG TPA: HDOD domain-containing protein [Terracidiphilus sp.]|nr:HDOD domain-containing protein [Terracidiphilus sp.]